MTPYFATWPDFEKDFTSSFCPHAEATAALNKLESTRYYQGRKTVDDYVDEFSELIEESGYTDGLAIVMKFRKGLDVHIQDRVAEMVQGRPRDDDPEGWYDAARRFDANRAANQAFHTTPRAPAATPIARTQFPIARSFAPPTMSNFPPRTSMYPGIPVKASNVPTPMEVDAARQRNASPMLCRRCGQSGHFVKDCPHTYDVRYMDGDEREAWIEHLLSAADIAAVSDDPPALVHESHAADTPPTAVSETRDPLREDFVSDSG
jgi:hypothetical protein